MKELKRNVMSARTECSLSLDCAARSVLSGAAVLLSTFICQRQEYKVIQYSTR